ncbi:CapA family protein [Paenibacillus alba]|uniref:CapA family protein n=1 Tax=Paenibacillus alba TaxID=1197127 RepID=A0ABU6GBZ6_9BACL|nr:CapA family protein [Paenibacillus alba]MEC0231713.1 CapA family protein [Paenibacillus alba]
MKRTVAIVSTLLLAAGCFHKSATPNEIPIEPNQPITKVQSAAPPATKPLVIASIEEEPLKPRLTKVTLAAIGDVLIHDQIYKDAEQKDGTYQFKPMFGEVKRFLESPDILVANQETMIGGKALRLSNYPAFNSPHEVGDALKDAGVDMVTIANNHSLDRGEKVIQSALTYWDTLGMPYTGTFKSQNDRDQIRTMTKNEITFSFLSYTYGTNGITTPNGKPFLVNRIDENQIRQDVIQAKQMSDVVVVALHWGKEYQRFPDHDQVNLAQKLADMGVHIIIGNHPHVLQPPAWVYGKNGHRTFVLYSLGNFISAQKDLYKQIGGMATIEVTKTKSKNQSSIALQNPSFLPTYTHSHNGHQFRIISMDRITNEQLPHAAAHYEKIRKHMQTYMQELHFLSSNVP